MKKIGILSDTHGYIHPRVSDFFCDCHEIWHAGDIGDMQTAETLAKIKPLRAVYGNIDGADIRKVYNEVEIFHFEEVKVLLIHIGGYPGKYTQQARKLIREYQPRLFITGHSHILKIMPDTANQMLHINPGAAGKFGLHHKITMIRLAIDGKSIKDLEVFEANKI